MCIQENNFNCFEVRAIGEKKSNIPFQDTLSLYVGERKTDICPAKTHGEHLNNSVAVKFSSHCVAETGCLYWNCSDHILSRMAYGTLPSFNSGGQNVPTSWQLRMNGLRDKFQSFSFTDLCRSRD